jgi:outer membrane lipoprotein-sorting protein
MSSFLRRLPLPRLLLLCAVIVAVGVGVTALATALSTGPTPAPKPLAQAVHDALSAAPVDGVSARIQLTDHLIEGASLAGQTGGGGGGIASSPLLTGASGRLWIAADGRLRLELQSEKGDTQILYDGHTISLYDASSNSLYRYAIPRGSGAGESSGEGSAGGPGAGGPSDTSGHHGIPTVSEIQETIAKVMRHANLSGAVPTDVAGQPAYSVRISPSHDGGLVGGAELAWDAVHGTPLRLAVYSTHSSSPVLELAATEISYEAVPDSVFSISPPPGAKVTEVKPPSQPEGGGASSHPDGAGSAPKRATGLSAVQAAVPFTLDAPPTLAGMARGEAQSVESNGRSAALIAYGQGLGGIAVIESQAKTGAGHGSSGGPAQSLPAGLGQVKLTGATATELPTALGTLLQLDRAGVSYLLVGSVTPATIEAAAKGL